MQFSIPPWYFDNETDAICLSLVNFRINSGIGFYIEKLASRLDGIPIIRPMWWNNTNADASVFTMNNQFMIGDEIIVAPILDEGAISRNIYIPAGKWLDPTTNSTIIGPKYLNNYPAPLEIIPYFLLESGEIRRGSYFN
jgi:alpha-glucosidase (family GH31 glycosyl hydrolase)